MKNSRKVKLIILIFIILFILLAVYFNNKKYNGASEENNNNNDMYSNLFPFGDGESNTSAGAEDGGGSTGKGDTTTGGGESGLKPDDPSQDVDPKNGDEPKSGVKKDEVERLRKLTSIPIAGMYLEHLNPEALHKMNLKDGLAGANA
jgi:hypothetical protein